MVVGQRPRVCQYNGNSNLRKEAMGKERFAIVYQKVREQVP